MDAIENLHREILRCTHCQDAGCIERAAPVVCAPLRSPMVLIGQAPGQVELTKRYPFAGRAGRELFRWIRSIGIEEEEFRARVYMTSITKCFPGKATTGSGDRRPSGREISFCRPWLEWQLALLRPRVVLLVGGLAIERYFPKRQLRELIGKRFDLEGVAYIPLPHPSGASRWLNQPANRDLLRLALILMREEWDLHLGASGRVPAAAR
ncbi:MAG: uracil-DNA glycosylase family protein [Chloroflexota bacterium]|nr:uracil-DNA glycosylase family protein [Chloroflexota bacterium]